MTKMQRVPIKTFRPVSAKQDSTEIGAALTKAQNLMLRPVGAFKCAPILKKLWGFGASQTPFATFDALTHPTGVGTIGASDKTIAVRIYYQGRNLAMFFNMWTGTHNGQSVTPGLRGIFNLGRDDGSLTDFDPGASGPPLFEVLAYNLDPAARWYGDFSHGQLNCQNGVDDPVAIQIGRTQTPGKWRKRGTNAVPSTPVLSVIEPQKTLNTQAKRTITGRSGGVDLVFTASSENFIGERGNNRIKVKIVYGGAYTSDAITSTLSGDGTTASPYLYTIYTTETWSSNSHVIAHVNNDSKIKPILSASGANTVAPDTFDDDTLGNTTGVFLSGGVGSGDSEGLTSAYYDVYARYWDGGHKLLGYEGPSSNVSNAVVIDATTFKDLLIQVDVDETAESGRFSHSGAGIRIYLRNGQETGAVWNLMNEDGFLLNSHRTQRVIAAGGRLWSVNTAVASLTTDTNLTNDTLVLAHSIVNGRVFMLQSGSVGLPLDTKLYAVNCQANTPSPGSTTFQLSLTLGGSPIDITATLSINLYLLETNQWSSSDQVIIPSGGGASAPSPLALDTRYWIRSIESDGYGVNLASSRLGSAITILSSGSNLSLKVVAVSMVVGSTTEPGRGMSTNQNRPPAHRYLAMAGGFNWCAGFSGFESKMLSSKEQQFDELSPEGVDLEDEDFVRKSRSTSAFRITGLWSDMRSLHVHCEDGIVILDPNDTEEQQEPLIDTGMVNGQCHSVSDGNQIVFLAFNRQIMSFNGARYGNRASKAKTDDAVAYINNYIDNNAITSRPDDCCLLHDKESSMIWFWIPGDSGSVGFGYDEALDGIVGPFTAPMNITGACSLESAIGCHIFATKDGYLFAMDAINQYDHHDVISSTAPVLNLTTDPLPADHAGYDYQDITATVGGSQVTRRLFYSQKSILETGLIDMGSPSTMKKFTGIEWRSIAGSRGHVKITAIDHSGRERGMWYGELGGKSRNRPHSVRFSIVDTAIKLRIEVYSAEKKPWLIRDVALLVA